MDSCFRVNEDSLEDVNKTADEGLKNTDALRNVSSVSSVGLVLKKNLLEKVWVPNATWNLEI